MAIPFYKASTFTGLVSTKNYGTSEDWNSAFTTVKSNSAAWAVDTRSLWGSISGTLSAQTDLWSYLSAGGTSSFDITTLNNYLSTTPVLLSSLNVNGTLLSAGVNLFDIFLTTETDSQTLTFTESSAELSILNGNFVSLSALDVRGLSGNWQETYTNVSTNSANWNIAYTNSTETFESISKNLKTYPYTVNYTNSVLTSIEYTLPDNKSIIKMFGYTNTSLLTAVSLSGDLPSGIDTTKTLSYTVNNTLTGVTYS